MLHHVGRTYSWLFGQSTWIIRDDGIGFMWCLLFCCCVLTWNFSSICSLHMNACRDFKGEDVHSHMCIHIMQSPSCLSEGIHSAVSISFIKLVI